LLDDVVVCTGADVVDGAVVGGATGAEVFATGGAEVAFAAVVLLTGCGALEALVAAEAGFEACCDAAALLFAVVGVEEDLPDALEDGLAARLEGAEVPFVDAVDAAAELAGADLANIVTNATAASVLRPVVRHVSFLNRRSPSDRPPSSRSSATGGVLPEVSSCRAGALRHTVARRQHIGSSAKPLLRSR
jgi:hypothetical protein